MLVRHAVSHANTGDFTAFGNQDSPLTTRGTLQAKRLKVTFAEQYGIYSQDYRLPVVASEFRRTHETAKYAGFVNIEVNDVVNEARTVEIGVSGQELIRRHAREQWAPDETMERAQRFIDLVRSGGLSQQIFFSHGVFIASAKLILAREAEQAGHESPFEFSETRGYIPSTATITQLTV